MLVGDIAHRGARMFRDRIACSWPGGERTYGELEDRVARMARVLHDARVGDGTRVATLALNHPDVLEFCLAASRLGAVVVPLNARLAPDEIRFQVDDAGATHVLVDPLLEQPARASGLLDREHWTVGEGVDAAIAGRERLPDGVPRPSAQDPSIQLYTSGTTGRPKGCLLGQAGWLASNANAAARLGLGPEDRLFAFAPFFHVAGFGISLTVLTLGGEVAIPPSLDPAEVWAHVAARRLTVLQYPFLRALLEHPDASAVDRSSLRLVMGGANMEGRTTLARVGEVLPHTRFFGIYGSTEAGNYTTLSTGEDERERPGTIGRPLMGFDVAVLDEDDREVPVGEAGELGLRGPSTMLGYWNLPEATDAALRSGWLHTGDVVRMDADGYLYFVDRVKDMIKSGGENVYSIEVEAVLAEHPDVADVAVVGVPDRRWGEAVKALVVATPGATPDPEILDEFCAQRLGGFKRPRWYEVVDAIPRSPLGKTLKRELRDAHDPEAATRLSERS